MNIALVDESIRFTKLPTSCIELIWASGVRVLAMPTVYLAAVEWNKNDDGGESVVCDWGSRVITLHGFGLQRIPGCLIRGEICAIMELPMEISEVTTGTVVTEIRTVEKKREE